MEKRILLVEDDAGFREVFTDALGQALASDHLEVAFVEASSLAEASVRLREAGLDAADRRDAARRKRPGARGRDQRRRRGQPHPDHGIDGEPGDLRGRPGDRAGSKGSALQADFDAGYRRCDQEADQRRTLRVMSTPPDEWGSVFSVAALAPTRVNIFQRPR